MARDNEVPSSKTAGSSQHLRNGQQIDGLVSRFRI